MMNYSPFIEFCDYCGLKMQSFSLYNTNEKCIFCNKIYCEHCHTKHFVECKKSWIEVDNEPLDEFEEEEEENNEL